MPSIVQSPTLKPVRPPASSAPPCAPQQSANSQDDRPSFHAALEDAKSRPRQKPGSESRERSESSKPAAASSKKNGTKSAKSKRAADETDPPRDDDSQATQSNDPTQEKHLPTDANAPVNAEAPDASKSSAEDHSKDSSIDATTDDAANQVAAAAAAAQPPSAPVASSVQASSEGSKNRAPASKEQDQPRARGAIRAIRDARAANAQPAAAENADTESRMDGSAASDSTSDAGTDPTEATEQSGTP